LLIEGHTEWDATLFEKAQKPLDVESVERFLIVISIRIKVIDFALAVQILI